MDQTDFLIAKTRMIQIDGAWRDLGYTEKTYALAKSQQAMLDGLMVDNIP